MSKAMNLWIFTIFACILFQAYAAVIPQKHDKSPTKQPKLVPANSTLQSDKSTDNDKKDEKATTNKPTLTIAATTTTLHKTVNPKLQAKPMPKEETAVKKPEEKPHVDLVAGPMKSEKKKDYSKLEVPSANSSLLHFLFVVILIVGCCCIATTYRKKLMGYFIGIRRTRRSGNVRYRRLSTGEAAIE